MDTRKTTLIASIIVILLLAVGVGYAYTAYTANEGNTTEAAYVKVTQIGETTPYTFVDDNKIKFDTYNEDDNTTVYYKLNNPTVVNIPGIGKYDCVALGSITLKAELTNNITGNPDLNIDVFTSEGFDASQNWVYFLMDSTATKLYAYKASGVSSGGWADGIDECVLKYSESYQKTVCVYVGYPESSLDIDKYGVKFLSNINDVKYLDNAALVFQVENSDATKHDLPTIVYDKGNGALSGTTTQTTVTVLEGSNVLLATEPEGYVAPTDHGDYVFKGWSETSEGTTTVPSVNVDKDGVTVFALWGEA